MMKDGSIENEVRNTGCNQGIATGTCSNITNLINRLNRLYWIGHNDILSIPLGTILL